MSPESLNVCNKSIMSNLPKEELNTLRANPMPNKIKDTDRGGIISTREEVVSRSNGKRSISIMAPSNQIRTTCTGWRKHSTNFSKDRGRENPWSLMESQLPSFPKYSETLAV
ncbi:SICAvar type I [Sesbania bispinosa]|nr:SICAvar type I [Sesbania bispinosa]